jgi:acetyltransferase-like isoleucine patch superfamily enzyme
MRRDNKPYTIRLLINWARRVYTQWRLVPQFDSVGTGLEIIGPRGLEIYGPDIHLGDNVHMKTAKGQMSRLCTWPDGQGGNGRIDIGNHCLLTPGLQIVSANHVTLGNNVMIASRVYISDADWHDVYDRLASPGPTAPVHLGDNVWLGEGTKVCKGVSIGENTVVGAGSVVASSLPANIIAAGNPAREIKKLDEATPLNKREAMFADRETYDKTMRYLHYLNHKENSYIGWLRELIWPSRQG